VAAFCFPYSPLFEITSVFVHLDHVPKEFQNMIHDDLTGRTDLSRQYIHQVRKRRRGICMICTRPLAATSVCFCAEHSKNARERQRNRLGCKRRYYGAKGYQVPNDDRLNYLHC